MIKNVGNKPYSQAIPIRDAREGMKFNRLTLLEKLPREKYEHEKWLCECECGKIKEYMLKFVLRGTTKSCGCRVKEIIVKISKRHGHAKRGRKIREYGIWCGMIKRCHGISPIENYINRGITVCERWKNSFQNFYDDMGPSPTPEHSIDRIDNNGNYEPSNCRWATRIQQANNKTNTKIITYKGQEFPMSEICRKLGLSRGAVKMRLKRGWSVEDALSTPMINKNSSFESGNKEPQHTHPDQI